MRDEVSRCMNRAGWVKLPAMRDFPPHPPETRRLNEQAGNPGLGGRPLHAAPGEAKELDERVGDPGSRGDPFSPPAHEAGPVGVGRYESGAGARGAPWRALGLPGLMFALTLLSTLLAGALQRGVTPDAVWRRPSLLLVGLPYSLTLLVILGAHEMGHYLASRKWGVDASLPYFLPAPSFLGTFGAVIRIRGRILNRNALMDVAVAGPLAGLAAAVPAVFIGLMMSRLTPEGVSGGIELGSPLLFDGIAWLVYGPIPEGQDILLHPVAFAGWCGLLVTSLNLIPAGQLDGGHITYTLLGRWHAKLSVAIGLVLLVMGYWWPGWIFWSVMVLLLGRRHPPLMDEWEPLTRKRRFWGFGCMIILICTFTLAPIRLF